MKYKAISLFSGAMGLDIGLEQAGFEVATCVEIDKLACETIKENTKIPIINKDINDVTSKEILEVARIRKDDVFLVAGGPPCQAFSTAGSRKALDDFRGNVIFNFLRIVKELDPDYFIFENVRGLLSSKLTFVPEMYDQEYHDLVDLKGGVLYFLVQEFKKYGYTVSFSLFNSANYGIPQKRERVIMFGAKGAKRIPLPSPTHSENGDMPGISKWASFEDALRGLKKSHDFIPLRKNSEKYLKYLKAGENWRNLPKEMQVASMGKSYYLSGGKTGFFRRLAFDKPSPTLVTSPTMPATMLIHPEEMRPLSIQEYARIQQFPDNWVFKGSLTQKYRQIGNAVPTGLGYIAGKTILDFHQGCYDVERERKNKIPYSRYKNCSDFEFIPLFEKLLRQSHKGYANILNSYTTKVNHGS